MSKRLHAFLLNHCGFSRRIDYPPTPAKRYAVLRDNGISGTIVFRDSLPDKGVFFEMTNDVWEDAVCYKEIVSGGIESERRDSSQ